ncbi:methionyl-tRNA formyltransferase [Candidatus Poribacteria bacterium]
MRTIFMGTDRFAVPTLKAVIDSDVELLCVITQPDRPKGRKLKPAPSPVKEVALENNLLIHQPERVRKREFVDEVLGPLLPDIIIVVAFGQILRKAVLDLPPLGCINLHPSLLPKYRGAAPVQRTIMNGEEVTGITVMFLDEGEDTGDIILQEQMEIDISDTAELLSQKLAELGARLIQGTLQLARIGPLPRQVQDHSRASHAPKLGKEDGLIDWGKSAFEIHNLIRGTVPWPGAYTTFGEAARLKIWESRSLVSPRPSAPPGTITDILPDAGIVVAAGDTGLLITTVQPASKSKMAARDFANGYRLKVGDTFL